MADLNHSRLVELYGALKRAPGKVMQSYWTGRIEEFAAQNAISNNELELARREARRS